MDVPSMFTEFQDHGFNDVSPTRMLSIIQDTVWQIEGLRAWPFLMTTWNLTFDGTNSFPTVWPQDPMLRASVRLIDQSTGRRILPVRAEEALSRQGIEGSQVGTPMYYYFIGQQLNVFPIPNATTMTLYGAQWSDPLTTSSPESAFLIPKQFHRGLIVNGALQRLYAMEDDTELAPLFQSYQSAAMDMAVEALFKQQYDRGDHVRVEDPDSWEWGQTHFLGPVLLNP